MITFYLILPITGFESLVYEEVSAMGYNYGLPDLSTKAFD
jgi:hypothetical protein